MDSLQTSQAKASSAAASGLASAPSRFIFALPDHLDVGTVRKPPSVLRLVQLFSSAFHPRANRWLSWLRNRPIRPEEFRTIFVQNRPAGRKRWNLELW